MIHKKLPKTIPHSQSYAIEVPQFGLPGFQYNLVLRHHYRDPNHPKNTGGIEGSPGKYKVVFTLSRPGLMLKPENNCSLATCLEGDSHLAITKPAYANLIDPDADQIQIDCSISATEHLVFRGHPNAKGFLGKLEIESFDAEHFKDAASKACCALLPALSNLSMHFDIPIYIYQIDLTELGTNAVRISLLTSFIETPLFGSPPTGLSKEFCIYASLYREALNSNSLYYQFLCYYKIIEGIRKRRERLTRETMARGEHVTHRHRLLIPNTPPEQRKWLNSIFPIERQWDELTLLSIFLPASLNRNINDIVDKNLTPIRNRIAHTVLRKEEPTVSIDDVLDLELVNSWLPLTKCITRLMMKMEFPGIW